MFTLIAYAAENATTESSGGLAALGVNLPSLIFQVVNFAILLWILKKFAYGPILNILNQRRATIEESLKNAEIIETTKRELEAEKKRILQDAQLKATELINRSREQAATLLAEAQAEAQAKVDRLLSDAQTTLAQDIAQARGALKQELAGLVISATEKLLKKKLDKPGDEKLIKEALKTVES